MVLGRAWALQSTMNLLPPFCFPPEQDSMKTNALTQGQGDHSLTLCKLAPTNKIVHVQVSNIHIYMYMYNIHTYIWLLLFGLITERCFIIELPGYLLIFFRGPVFVQLHGNSSRLPSGFLPDCSQD